MSDDDDHVPRPRRTVAVFVWDRLPVAIVAIGVALSLWATGVLELEQALAGFGDPTVIFIASLFVVSEGLDATGVTAWAGQELIARAGDSRDAADRADDAARRGADGADQRQRRGRRAGAGRRGDGDRLRHAPSQLLMPLAFGAHAGSLLALTGTPVNVIVSERRGRRGRRAVRLLRVRARRRPARRGHDRDRRALRRAAAARRGRRARSRPTSATTRGRSSSSTRSTTTPDALVNRARPAWRRW